MIRWCAVPVCTALLFTGIDVAVSDRCAEHRDVPPGREKASERIERVRALMGWNKPKERR